MGATLAAIHNRGTLYARDPATTIVHSAALSNYLAPRARIPREERERSKSSTEILVSDAVAKKNDTPEDENFSEPLRRSWIHCKLPGLMNS